MRKGRKILGITTAVIVLLCGSFYACIAYRVAVAARTPVSRYATGMVRINMHALYRSMLPEYFSRGHKGGTSMLEGLEIPSDIFFYPVKGKHNTTIFGSLKIADSGIFAQTVIRWGLIPLKSSLPGDIHLSANTSKTVTLAYDNERVILAFSPEREDVQTVLVNILLGKDIIPVKESSFKDVLRRDGHIVFLSGATEATVNFCKGVVKADMNLRMPGLIVPGQVQRHVPAVEPAISMWLYAGGPQWLQDIRIGGIQLDKDSINNYHLQGLELAVSGPVIQKDSVITYEYNDDFEKVPVVTVQESSVPGMQALVSCNAKGLYGYLRRMQVIEQDSNQVNRKLFPLYRLYAYPGDEYLQVATMRAPMYTGKTKNSAEFFGLEVDFKRLTEQKDFNFLLSYIGKLDRLDAGAVKHKDGAVALRAKLLFKQKESNAIWQVIESL